MGATEDVRCRHDRDTPIRHDTKIMVAFESPEAACFTGYLAASHNVGART